MASRRGPAYWVGLCGGWLLVVGWLAMLALNAAPYLQGAAPPPLGDLLTHLVTPPGLPLPPDLAALAGWALAAVALVAAVILARADHLPAARQTASQATARAASRKVTG